jgi:hypothetical protein
MIKRTLTQSDYFLIAANLLPVIGAWFWNWDPKQVFMVYCLETVIIGLFNLLKMGIVTAVRKKDMWYNAGSSKMVSGLFFMLFFLVHYGMFVAIQTGLFIQVSQIGKDYHIGFFDFFLNWPKYIGKDAYIMLAGFVVSYGFKMLWDFILKGEYKTISMMKLMFQPYMRIFIQQFTVIIGSIFVGFGAGKVFILIFACIKIFFELYIDYEGILNKGVKEMEKESGKNISSP